MSQVSTTSLPNSISIEASMSNATAKAPAKASNYSAEYLTTQKNILWLIIVCTTLIFAMLFIYAALYMNSFMMTQLGVEVVIVIALIAFTMRSSH